MMHADNKPRAAEKARVVDRHLDGQCSRFRGVSMIFRALMTAAGLKA